MAVPQSGYDELSALTNRHFVPKMHDQIRKTNPAFGDLWAKGEKLAGGHEIHVPLDYSTQKGGGYKGFDELNTTHEDDYTVAIYTPTQSYEPISISRADELKNKGSKTQMLNLIKNKVKSAGNIIKDAKGTELFTATTDSTRVMLGLPDFFPTDPDADTSIGGINRLSHSWWRHSVTDFSTALTAAMVIDGINVLENEGQRPNRCYTNYTLKADIEILMDDGGQRYAQSDNVGKIGFNDVMVHGVKWVADSHCPVDRTYMFHTDCVEIKSFKDENMRFDKFRKPHNQNAQVAFIFWMGQLCVSDMRKTHLFYT